MSRFFIHRPVFAGVIAIIIVLAGIVAAKLLAVSQYPEIAPPTVLITTSYRVADDALAEFIEVMYDIGQARRRTGGHSWRLYRSGEGAEIVVEQFVVPSWAEFHHQHTVRWLSSDHDVMTKALALTLDGTADQQALLRIR